MTAVGAMQPKISFYSRSDVAPTSPSSSGGSPAGGLPPESTAPSSRPSSAASMASAPPALAAPTGRVTRSRTRAHAQTSTTCHRTESGQLIFTREREPGTRSVSPLSSVGDDVGPTAGPSYSSSLSVQPVIGAKRGRTNFSPFVYSGEDFVTASGRKTKRPLTATGRPSHSKRPSTGHIKRPRNAFIFFRSDVTARGIITKDMAKDMAETSIVVSRMWKELSNAEKAPYMEMARKEKEEHAFYHPGYKYQPKATKTPKGKRSTSRSPTSDPEPQAATEELEKVPLPRRGRDLARISESEAPPDFTIGSDETFAWSDDLLPEEGPLAKRFRRSSSAPPFVTADYGLATEDFPTFAASDDLGVQAGSDSVDASFEAAALPVVTVDSTFGNYSISSSPVVGPSSLVTNSPPTALKFGGNLSVPDLANQPLISPTNTSFPPSINMPVPQAAEPAQAEVDVHEAAIKSTFKGDLMLISPFDMFDRKSSLGRFCPGGHPSSAGSSGSGVRRESRALILRQDDLPLDVLETLADAQSFTTSVATPLAAPPGPVPPAGLTEEVAWGLGINFEANGNRRPSVSVAGHGELGIFNFPNGFLEQIPESQTFDFSLGFPTGELQGPLVSDQAFAGVPSASGPLESAPVDQANLAGWPPADASSSAALGSYSLVDAPSLASVAGDPALEFSGFAEEYDQGPIPQQTGPSYDTDVSYKFPPDDGTATGDALASTSSDLPMMGSFEAPAPPPLSQVLPFAPPPPSEAMQGDEGEGYQQPGTFVFLNRSQAGDTALIEHLLSVGYGVTFRAVRLLPGGGATLADARTRTQDDVPPGILDHQLS